MLTGIDAHQGVICHIEGTETNKKRISFMLPRYNNPATRETEYTLDFSLNTVRDLRNMLDDYLKETIDIKTEQEN